MRRIFEVSFVALLCVLLAVPAVAGEKEAGAEASPVTDETVEVNEKVKAAPSLINSDPYGDGWFVRVKPTDWAGESASLVTGDTAVAAYQKFMEEQNLSLG